MTVDTTPSASPTLDHDTLLFVLEALKESITDTRAHQNAANGDGQYQMAARYFFECSALSRFGDRLVAAYKERQ